MKVISGKYKGLTIKGFDIDGTRPTMDRVKESVFAMIQNYLDDSTVLDLFAGSGNLGIESLSNGAKCAYFIDNNKTAIDVIGENIKKIKIKEEVHIIKNDYNKALNTLNIKFDIIFLDPPYKDKIINEILDKIYNLNLLNENGLIVIEYEFDDIDNNHFKLIKQKRYGTKKIMIYKNEK